MIWQEPPRGGSAPAELWARSGLEQIQAMIAWTVPAPPIHHLTGMMPTSAREGEVDFQMPATGWLASPSGFILGGVLGVLADGPLGSAIQTTFPPGTPYTTSELSMSFLRPAVADGRMLRSRGRLVQAGRSLALSEATVADADGRDLAHCTSRCFIFPAVDVPSPPPPLPPLEPPVYDAPDPYLRPVEGEPLDPEVWRTLSGMEIMRGLIDGTLPAPPIHHLTGQHPVAAEEGSCTFVMPATGWLPSPTGFVEGGTLVMLADAALASAAQTTVAAGMAVAPADITVKFIRPVAPDGSELRAVARVVHRGRTTAVCEAQILNAEGKVVCVALGSAMILNEPLVGGREPTLPPPASRSGLRA
jgi:uncharacterized protein (TIGR00369 family)